MPTAPHALTGRAGLDAVDPDQLDAAVAAAADAVVAGDLALLAVAGSYQYGLAHPGRSDLDLRGVYVAPTEQLLGLRRPAEQYEVPGHDTVVYEVGKALRLAAGGNANVLEILHADEHVVRTADGDDIVAAAHACLSQAAVSRYAGYATGQLHRAERIVDGSAGGDGRFAAAKRAKHVRHTFRLLAQVHAMAVTGRLQVPVPAALADELDELSARPLDELTVELDARIAAARAAAADGPLPEHPDLDVIDAALLRIRRRHLAR